MSSREDPSWPFTPERAPDPDRANTPASEPTGPLFDALNAGVEIAAGAKVVVANVEAPPPEGKVSRIEEDKAKAQLRAYYEEDRIVVAYPATIGSDEYPSPSCNHNVNTVAE